MWPLEIPNATPSRVPDLDRAEQLVLLALRRRHEAGAELPQLRTLFFLACGLSHTEAALAGFEGTFQALERRARRRLVFRSVTAAAVGADERAVLSLVAAQQAGHRPRVQAVTSWLVHASAAPALERHSARLGRALAACGHRLPLAGPPAPVGGVPSVCATTAGPTSARPTTAAAPAPAPPATPSVPDPFLDFDQRPKTR